MANVSEPPRGLVDQTRLRRHKLRNALHSWLLLAGSVGLLAVTAWSLAGPQGMIWIAVAGAIFLWSAARMTPDLVLRLYRTRKLPANVFPEGNRMVRILSERAGLSSVPELHYIPSRNMNAFAVGRDSRSAIAVTDGIVRGLTPRQFFGVVAHEISHIANDDVKAMALADMVSRLTNVMATVGVLALVFFMPSVISGGSVPWLGLVLLMIAPTLSGLLQLALSRTREYDADLDAAHLTGDPEGLASALTVLERRQGAMWERLMLPGSRMPDPSLLRSHPRTEERVRRLRALRIQRDDAEIGKIIGGSVPAVPAGISPVRRGPRLHRTGVWY